MIPFDFQLRTRIVFGPGRVDSLGEFACELGARRALVVSDPGIVAAGHTSRGVSSLDRAGIETHLFDGVTENPTDRNVEAGVAMAKKSRPELIVGLGGGSSMDCAKGINFVYSCGGRIQDYWGTGKATRPLLPLIAVPTTAGTGSEAQSFALISDSQTHVKMACGDKKASCRVALLDPTLTVTQPAGVTALTGIDAVAHAVETYVTNRRNAVSLAFSREAWQLLAENFSKVLAEPTDLDARGGMQLGACFAGLAIENSMLGATHALANPLTAFYGIAHGQAVGMMLPHVIRFNGVEFDGWYRDLLEYVPSSNGDARDGASQALADVVGNFARLAGLPERLSQCGVERERLPVLAADAAKQWTGTFNPRKVGVQELLSIYETAF
ncbi:MAG TPA: iron-containing alcohol dehydrogenase [Pirellulales bacterium]|jgi:alcohol dehydrogenase|nr:iron-containing alcohol dehydrogenase [Pirellulales bacterium]